MWSDITDVFLKSAFPGETDSGSYQDFKQLYRAFKEQIWQESNVKKYRGKIEKMHYGVSCGTPAGLTNHNSCPAGEHCITSILITIMTIQTNIDGTPKEASVHYCLESDKY